MAAARLHLGDTEHALAQLASAVAEPPPLFTYKGIAEATRFGATALVGRVKAARMLFGEVEPWLAAVDKRNLYGRWAVLDASVPGLILAGDVNRCGALYPSCVSYLSTGAIGDWLPIVPGILKRWLALRPTPPACATGRGTISKLRSVRPTRSHIGCSNPPRATGTAACWSRIRIPRNRRAAAR